VCRPVKCHCKDFSLLDVFALKVPESRHSAGVCRSGCCG